jgi:glyoxalase family protein
MPPSALATSGFHHITMVSSDARRTLAFYRDLLGIRLVKRTVNFDDPEAYHLYFGDATGAPGTILTFFEWSGLPRGRWGIGGIHHLALGTATAETQLMWKRRLNDHGVPVSGPLNRGYFRSIYFTDPDGQILEVATRGPGYAVDEPPDALGREEVSPPADAQIVGHRDEGAIRALTHPEPVPEVTPEMRLEGIHHITGISQDLVRADEFYHAALGLRIIKKTFNQDDPATRHWFWASYDGTTVAPHSSLSFFGWPRGGRAARPGVGQTHHIAFRAATSEQQLAWRDHLESSGIAVTEVLDRTYFRSIYFRAPDGLLLEIATDGPGFLVDEPAERLGGELRLPAWLEPERERITSALVPL